MTPRPEKRRAILDAGRRVFAEHGYLGASTQMIADGAAVSTRTLYKHFPSKQELFRDVLVEGAREVADGFEAAVAAVPADAGLEPTVTGLAHALAAHRLDFAEHFALADQLGAYVRHLPEPLVDAWRAAGPDRVQRAVACRLADLGARGLLDAADPDEAAHQLTLLVAGAIAFGQRPAGRLAPRDPATLIRSGVRTFLWGHAPDEHRVIAR